MRNIFQMKGIKEQIDELLKPLKDDTLANTTYADDISRLMKAWENDIATLDKMGYPEVAKAFDEYDKFVSSGMLLWGTNVGKAAAQGELKKRGFQLVLDGSTTRASHSLFDVVINSAKQGTLEGRAEIEAIKRIVGDRGYQNGLGTYINDAFDLSLIHI